MIDACKGRGTVQCRAGWMDGGRAGVLLRRRKRESREVGEGDGWEVGFGFGFEFGEGRGRMRVMTRWLTWCVVWFGREGEGKGRR